MIRRNQFPTILLVATTWFVAIAPFSSIAADQCEELFKDPFKDPSAVRELRPSTQLDPKRSSIRSPETVVPGTLPLSKLGRQVLLSAAAIQGLKRYTNSSLRTFEAKDGHGKFYVFEVEDSKASRATLIKAVLRFPQFFARFDIYADAVALDSKNMRYRLMMPDSERLSLLSPNGIRYVDVPFYRKQHFPETEFQDHLLNGEILMASRGYYFGHDRLEEHLMAGLLIPSWMVSNLKAYAGYIRKIKATTESQSVLNNPDFEFEFEFRFMPQPGQLWDTLTAQLFFIGNHNRSSPQENFELILLTKQILAAYAKSMRLGAGSRIGSQIAYLYKREPDRARVIHEELDRLADTPEFRPFTQEISEAFLLSESIRIASELTGLSQTELRDTWNKYAPRHEHFNP